MSSSLVVRPELVKILSSTITGTPARRPASTARSMASHPGLAKCAVLMPTITSLLRRIVSEVLAGSISSTSLSYGSPTMPLPTMLSSARTRVFDCAITVRRNSSKVRQPLPPASTMVVVPAGSAVSSGTSDPS